MSIWQRWNRLIFYQIWKKDHIYVFFMSHHRCKSTVNKSIHRLINRWKKIWGPFLKNEKFQGLASKVLLERVWRRKKNGGFSGSLILLCRTVCPPLGHCSEAHLFSSQVKKVCEWTSWNEDFSSQFLGLCPYFQVDIECHFWSQDHVENKSFCSSGKGIFYGFIHMVINDNFKKYY